MECKVWICDVCKERHEQNNDWGSNCNGGAMTIVPDGINGSVEIKDVCPTCRSILYNAFHEALNEIQK